MNLRVRLPRIPFRTSLRLLHTSNSLEPNHSIYVSHSTNPYFNLSLEDWLFRTKCHKEPLLLLYRDEPCVVIGRNQNPWKEVNLPLSKKVRIPFVRRKSGGGTVYHDLGNTNYSIHVPRPSFDRKVTAEVVVRALLSLGLDAETNDRNDICSAYKIANNRAYHHGTMLISTNLNTLGNLLRSNKETMISKGVASVPSPVRNLRDFDSEVKHKDFIDAIINSFREEYDIQSSVHIVEEDEYTTKVPAIRDDMQKLQEWNWAFGQTPEFEYAISEVFEWGSVMVKIRSKHGAIISCKFDAQGHSDDVEPQWLNAVSTKLEGVHYGFLGTSEDAFRGDNVVDVWRREVWDWLRESMD